MRICAWLTEGTWQACVDAAAEYAPPGADVTLLHVTDPGLSESVRGAWAARLGRAGGRANPGDAVEAAIHEAEVALLADALARLGRPARTVGRTGRPGREVIAACAEADLLVVARDGDHTRLGPHSLSPATRFVVDHAPCQVLLVWPDESPGLETMPPPPDH